MLAACSTIGRRAFCSRSGGGKGFHPSIPVGRRAVQASALRLLGLTNTYTARELRDAYFETAKQCHPDSASDEWADGERFLQLTEAYESLQKSVDPKQQAEQLYDTPSEEQEYRAACLAWLGLEVTYHALRRCALIGHLRRSM